MDGVVLLSVGGGQQAAGGRVGEANLEGFVARMADADGHGEGRIANCGQRKSGHPAPKVAPRRRIGAALTREPRCCGGVHQTGIPREMQMQGLDIG